MLTGGAGFSGAMLRDCTFYKDVPEWATAEENVQKLWELSEKLVGQKFEYRTRCGECKVQGKARKYLASLSTDLTREMSCERERMNLQVHKLALVFGEVWLVVISGRQLY
jgi:hypothetical protein